MLKKEKKRKDYSRKWGGGTEEVGTGEVGKWKDEEI
jgi:hypothetical protein